MIENKKYFIDQINSSKANKMTALYHYSKVGFKKAVLNLGVFRKSDNLMVGVLQWGCSFQEKIRLDRYVKEPISKSEYLELNRFCMADSEGANSESQAISLGIKWIKQNMPHIRLLVSYAGRKEGNYGYIYQATNWEYLGYFVSPGFWSIDGHEKHMMTLWCNYRTSDSKKGSLCDYLCDKYEDVRQTWTKQFIYITRLDKKLTPASAILPYPKPANEFPIKTKEKIYKQNDELYNNPIPIERPIVEYYYEKDKYLFTKAALLRRGEISKTVILQYNKFGQYENSYPTITAAASALGFPGGGIGNAIKTNKIYKDKYFRKGILDGDNPEEIELNCLAYIDEIPFYTQVEMAAYLGVTKQAVSQACKRHSAKIHEKIISWADEK